MHASAHLLPWSLHPARAWYLTALIVLVAGCAWIWISAPDDPAAALEDLEGPLAGYRAPAVSVHDLRNDEAVLWDGETGVPVVLNFWASWCPPCRREIPELIEAAARYGDDVLILGIVNANDGAAAVAMAEDMGINYRIAADTAGDGIFDLYEVLSFPTTYFIDRQGIVQVRYIGEMNAAVITEGVSRILN